MISIDDFKKLNIVVGTTSNKKIDIVKKVFLEFFKNDEITTEGYPAESGVPETPWNEETLRGALNRASTSKAKVDGDYYVGLESGLVERYGHVYEEAWCAIVTKDGKEYFGYSSGLKVPDYLLNKMKEMNLKHYELLNLLDKKSQLLHKDTWANYSGGLISREIGLEESIRNALVQLKAP